MQHNTLLLQTKHCHKQTEQSTRKKSVKVTDLLSCKCVWGRKAKSIIMQCGHAALEK